MGDFMDDLTEVDGHRSRLNTIVALSVAISASFVALCNVKDGNIVQAMAQAQANSVDAWSYYQAKSTKQSVAQSALDQLLLQKELTPPSTAEARARVDAELATYQQRIKKLEVDKAEIQKAAEGHQQEYDRLNYHDDQFDMAEALTSIAIALFGVTALTQRRALLVTAMVFAGLGVLLGVAGFAGLHIHPRFLAALLS